MKNIDSNSKRKDVYIYPIIISESRNDPSGYNFFIEIPDFAGFTQAKTFEESIAMARDYIGNSLVELDTDEEPFPKELTDYKNLDSLKNSTNDIVTTVDVSLKNFKYAHDNRTVRKNVTIPMYLDVLGKENKINFSEILTNSLKNLLVD